MEKRILLLLYIVFFSISVIAQDTSEDKAEQYTKRAKQEAASGNWSEAASNYNQAGYAWLDNGKLSKAREVFLESIAINKKTGNYNAVAHLYNTLGRAYADRSEFRQALDYLERGLELTKKHGAPIDIASVLINIGRVEAQNGNPEKAIGYTKEALTHALEKNNLSMIRDAYKYLSEYYEQTGNKAKAAANFDKYTAFDQKLQRQKQAQARKRMQGLKEEAQQIRRQKVQQQEALKQNKRRLQLIQDSLTEYEELSKQQQIKIDLLNKEKRIQELELQQQKAQRQQERIIRIVLIIGLIVVLGFSTLLFRTNRARKKANERLKQQNEEIQRQNEKINEQRRIVEQSRNELETVNKQLKDQNVKITNSINYAKTIQQAMLPAVSALNRFLEEAFVLLRPRDIVSGDFYWFTVPNGKGTRSIAAGNMAGLDEHPDELLVSAVDCTGHGVPGALMSMIGYSLLNEIVNSGIKQPDEILHELDERVKLVLQQDSKNNKDGMDLAMLHINRNTNTVSFSGAHNPVIYVQNGEVKEIKGTQRPIGGKAHIHKRKKKTPEPFKMHTIDIEQPTAFYIFSDGYIDQFGGEKNRKFMMRRLKQMIEQIHHLPMEEQNARLNQRLDEWQGNHPQIDDILVIGFRINPEN